MEMIILRWTNPARVLGGHVPVAAAESTPGDLLVETADLTAKEVAELRRDPDVYAAAPPIPTCLIQPESASEVTESLPVSWGVDAVGATTSAFNGAGVTVAVLDTGIDPKFATHPAFAGVSIEAKNFTNGSDGDTDGHGTHCAATIFGRTTDGCRIGVAPGVTNALIGKVIAADGGTTESVFRGILWAIDRGAHVISMSIGLDFPAYRERLAKELPPELATSEALAGYLSTVRTFDHISQVTSSRDSVVRGAVVVAAAGNESRRDVNPNFRITVGPPARADLFLSVAALRRVSDDAARPYRVAKFSNIGARVAAPGVDIVSAKLGGGLTRMSGTSMATPHVAGVAALFAQRVMKRRPFRAAEVIEDLERNVVDLDYLDRGDVGAGLVKAP